MSEMCFDDFDYDCDDDACEGCGLHEMDDGYGQCPFCCPMSGNYCPGSETCDWCRSSDECARETAQRMARKPRKKKIKPQKTA